MNYGPLSGMILYEERLREAISGSPILMADAGTDQEGIRANHLNEDFAWFEGANGVEVEPHLPLVIIRQLEFTITTDAVGSEQLSDGSYELIICRKSLPVAGGYDAQGYTRAKLDYLAWVSAFFADLKAGAGRQSQLNFREITMTVPPMRTRGDPAEHEPDYDFWQSGFSWNFKATNE